MADTQRMLEAHVAFEVARWSGQGWVDGVEEEVAALFAWAGSVRVEEITTPQAVVGGVERLLASSALIEAVDGLLDRAAQVAHDVLRADGTPLRDLVPREKFELLAGALIGVEPLRREVTRQVTASPAYVGLITHVLYHGIKSYLLTENVVARRVPGASSLLRFGQSAFSTAVPGLERTIDRQLTAFLAGNVAESIRESRHYLDTVLDEDLLWQVAEELWVTNSPRSVGQAADLVAEDDVAELVVAGRALFHGLRASTVVHDLVRRLVEDVFERYGSWSLAAVLRAGGLTPEQLSAQVVAVSAGPLARAHADGHLEARLRARLEAFYATQRGEPPAAGSPARRAQLRRSSGRMPRPG